MLTTFCPLLTTYLPLADMNSLIIDISSTTQIQCIEVAHGAIFMEQNMRFGLILGQLAIQWVLA
jgi:hypothetical protein